jgi:hypothetical protein
MNVSASNINAAAPVRRDFSGHFEIDQTPCRASYGLKEQLVMMRELSQQARKAAMEGLGRVVSEGNRMAHIENNEDAIVAIATEKSLKWDRAEVTWGDIAPPIIRYQPGSGRFVDLSV